MKFGIRTGAGLVIALQWMGCSSHLGEEETLVVGTAESALTGGRSVFPRYRSFATTGAARFAWVAAYGADSARINDGARVLNATGYSTVSSDLYVNLGTGTITGSVYSGATAFIRGVAQVPNAYRINGLLSAPRVETQNPGVFVAPASTYRAFSSVAPPLSLNLNQYQWIAKRSVTSKDLEIEPGALKLAVSDNYGRFTVKSNGTLLLTSGEYSFDELRLEPDARLVLCAISGNPIIINTRQGLDLGDRSAIKADASLVLFNHEGVNKARVGSAATFNGSIVAPNAAVEVVGGTLSTINGAFYGKSVEVHQQTVVHHVPFNYGTVAVPVSAADTQAATSLASTIKVAAGLGDADRLAAIVAQQTQANINALYAAQVAIEAATTTEYEGPAMDLSGYATIPEQATYLSGLTGVPPADIQAGLELMKANGIVYTNGLEEAAKGRLNKLLTDMVNDGKLNEAMAKKVQELGDFLSQQLTR